MAPALRMGLAVGNGVVLGIAIGLASNAIYDFMKSHQGIQDAIDYLKGQQK
jgi:hypothetical protein